ncbi:hypothetical protein KR009_010377 [Drosophila setifemur]|nr:hypothetical protein KR009_010377 [Drosophila setifemur]
MCSKRKLSMGLTTADQQENDLECPSTRIKRATGYSGRSILGESFQRKNTPSKFEQSWQALKKSGISSSQPESKADTSFETCSQLLNTSWPGTKRRVKALPTCIVQNSPRGPNASLLFPQTNRTDLRLSSSFRISQRWNELMNVPSVNDSSCTDLSEESFIESSPATQLVPEQSPSQYLSNSQKKTTPKPHVRIVKGGYVDEFRRKLKNVRMDQRHLSNMKANHTVQVLAITQEIGVSMALVEPLSGTHKGRWNFNILLPPCKVGMVAVGSKIKFYLDGNTKPLPLKNQEMVYFQPLNIVVL